MADFLNIDEYRDKVLGCWTGKNIGGTLGTPFEGNREIHDITFYTQDLKGAPAPNDDLDLQLVWLFAAERHGVYSLNERILAEYWLRFITGPWNEYGTAKANIVNGLYPPLSGFCNNEKWKNSNGAWIRSEIWACLFPASPDEAASYAWIDSCVDHADDGIYAEIFTAVLESAAFAEDDLGKLIDIGLTRIPTDCRVARSVRLAVEAHSSGIPWQEARNRIVEDSADLGWFQAPANVGFVTLALLYGDKDFGRSVCLAVNCGDDTDCTGATVGSILGIILGRSGLPKEWIEPIGESILTVAVTNYQLFVPATLQELTERVIRLKQLTEQENPLLVRLTENATHISDELRAGFGSGDKVAERVWCRSSRTLRNEFTWGAVTVEYDRSPVTAPGETQKLRLTLSDCMFDNRLLHLDWKLPDGWSMTPGPRQMLHNKMRMYSQLCVEITPGEFSGAMEYIRLELRLSDRNNPNWIAVPFQLRGAVEQEELTYCKSFWEDEHRRIARFAGLTYPRR